MAEPKRNDPAPLSPQPAAGGIAARALAARAAPYLADLNPEQRQAVETLDGRAAELSSLFGQKPVVIEFWATWCGVCKELEPRIMAVHERFKDRVTFVGVAVSANQSDERVRRYIAQHMQGFTHFYDRRGNAVSNYDVPATSYVVIVDAQGKVAYTGLGEDQDIAAALTRILGGR